MDDIIRKPMKNVIVSHNEIARRPSMAPELRPEDGKGEDRFEKNPFFEKGPSRGGFAPEGKKSSSRTVIWVFAALVLLGAVFLVANYFSLATVEITPFTRNARIDHDFVAVALKGAVEGGLAFNFTSIVEEKTKEVPATIEKKILKKASGKVLIFNAYNGSSQRLIKNTRLETADHKIFRIDESVVVPGMKVVGGKSVPGSVEALVDADAAGPEYNIEVNDLTHSDFTLPGFKGDPRYTKFTAKRKQDVPISGGLFCTSCKIASEEAILAAQDELKQDLKKVAVEKVRAQVPDGMSLFPGSMVIKFEEVPQKFTESDVSKVTVRAMTSVFFFDTVLLTRKLAEASLTEYKGNPLLISNMSALTFSFIDPVDSVVLSDLLKIRFHIVGDAVFVGQIDEQKIRSALIGKNKKDFGKIIIDQNNVGKAEAVIRPMWKTAFPLDPAKITVKILND